MDLLILCISYTKDIWLGLDIYKNSHFCPATFGKEYSTGIWWRLLTQFRRTDNNLGVLKAEALRQNQRLVICISVLVIMIMQTLYKLACWHMDSHAIMIGRREHYILFAAYKSQKMRISSSSQVTCKTKETPRNCSITFT